jgi:hypothetical protein
MWVSNSELKSSECLDMITSMNALNLENNNKYKEACYSNESKLKSDNSWVASNSYKVLYILLQKGYYSHGNKKTIYNNGDLPANIDKNYKVSNFNPDTNTSEKYTKHTKKDMIFNKIDHILEIYVTCVLT